MIAAFNNMQIRLVKLAGLLLTCILFQSCPDDSIQLPEACQNGILDSGEECIDCGGNCHPCNILSGRYAEPVFEKYDRSKLIKYSSASTLPYEIDRELYSTLYEPHRDTAQRRPLIILMGQTTYAMDPDGAYFTQGLDYLGDLLRKGFVVVHISNIRFWQGTYPMKKSEFINAAMKIRGDFLSCASYFTKYADYYRLDPENIFLMGASMGAMAALHAAFIDENDLKEMDEEWASYIEKDGGICRDLDFFGLKAKIKGVISLSGMMLNTDFIDEGEPSLLSIIGSKDAYRPFQCESVQVNWIEDPFIFCGPEAIKSRMSEVGFKLGDSQLKLIYTGPADYNAPFDPNQCPECPDIISDFILSKLNYCPN